MTQRREERTTQTRGRVALEVVSAEATIDVRLWARHYVATLLELESVSITPTAMAEAS